MTEIYRSGTRSKLTKFASESILRLRLYLRAIHSQAYQSNNLVYTILAKASRLSAAASGSSHFVIVSSRVTITRLQRESSSAFALHLKKIINQRCHMERIWNASLTKSLYFNKCKLAKFTHMKSSAAVRRWNQDFSSLGTDESISCPFVNSMLPRCKIAATTRNIASWTVTEGETKNQSTEAQTIV